MKHFGSNWRIGYETNTASVNMTKQLYGYDPLRMGIPVERWSGKFEALLVCPYHSDHEPSLSFNMLTGSFYCFSCGEAGGPRKLSKSFGGVCERSKITPKRFNKREATEWRVLLSGSLAVGSSYLIGRGVTVEQIEKHQITTYKHGIVIPIKNTRGTTVGAVLRHFEKRPKYLYFGDKPSVWWPSPLGKRRDVFVVEGVFGALAAERAGVLAVSTLGAMVKSTAKTQLNKFNPYIFFDNDFAGYLGACRLLKMAPLSRIILPGGEADELSIAGWEVLFHQRNVRSTRNVLKVLQYVNDKKRFIGKLKSNYWKRNYR
jgi:hypothetical protein